MTVDFTVRGIPQTQGSKRAFVNKRTGRPIITEDSYEKHRDWRARVADAAQQAANGAPLIDGPVHVGLTFLLPKPASAPKRKPVWPVGARSGDIDKLARCCLDAMTGVVYHDDSQVVSLAAVKTYGEPCVVCYVQPWTDTVTGVAS